jgi:hypothetical protein
VYTGASWHDVLVKMLAAHPELKGRMSNAEAAAFIREWHNVARPEHEVGRVWYQFAAVAYGWDPPRRDYLRRDKAQGQAQYDEVLTPELWTWANGIATALDKVDHLELQGPPRISLDSGTFEDPTFYGDVRAHLLEDGADALFKIPTGYCIDKKTGKRRLAKPPCNAKGESPIRDPRTGKSVPGSCDKRGECDAELIDDPITAAGNSMLEFAVMLAAVWLVLTPGRRKRA